MEHSQHLRHLNEDLEKAKVFYQNQQYAYVLPTLKSLWARAIHGSLCKTPAGLECGLKLASCFYQLGDFIEAHRTLKAVKQKCNPKDPEVILCEIFALNDFGEFEDAAVSAAELEAKFEQREGAEKNLQYESKTIHREKFAASLIESGQADEAIAVLATILGSKNNRISSLKLKTKALIELGDWNRASSVAKSIEELEKPLSQEAKELRAIVRMNLGEELAQKDGPHLTILEKNIAAIQGSDV